MQLVDASECVRIRSICESTGAKARRVFMPEWECVVRDSSKPGGRQARNGQSLESVQSFSMIDTDR